MRKILPLGLACLCFAQNARADAPAFLSVQGILARTDGSPIDGDTLMRFGLYTNDIGGTELWAETQTVDVDNGFFTIYLGDSTALDLAIFRNYGNVWLGVSVQREPEMSRLQITTTGYAAYAQFSHLSEDSEMLGGLTPDKYGPIEYMAGDGLSLSGTTFSANKVVLEDWSRGVCYDTPMEVEDAVSGVYASTDHTHSWSNILDIPACFTDGVDDNTLYSNGTGLLLSGNSFSLDTSFTDRRYVEENQFASIAPGMLVDGTALAEIIDNDGHASDLDADKLDGKQLTDISSSVTLRGVGCGITGELFSHAGYSVRFYRTATCDNYLVLSAVGVAGAWSVFYNFTNGATDTPRGQTNVAGAVIMSQFSGFGDSISLDVVYSSSVAITTATLEHYDCMLTWPDATVTCARFATFPRTP